MRLLPFRRRRSMNVKHFTERWQELQKHCASRKTWPQAIAEADDLLDQALKRAGYKGKTTGERLVSAQHDLTANDMIWLGHKLRNRLAQEEVDVRKLKKKDVVDSLAGFRQALRDLGALPS
ncbi:MAG TPA: hypothetical protein VD706_03315 [Candidatus Saccharimonadales bacterium]|nr:hypothetical protein [Candidatus Saccharimonadales bacterium]